MEDQAAEQLEQLYYEMYEWLFGYANASLSDPSRSEEAVQETFRIACDKLPVLLNSENPKGWLVNTLKGVLRNFCVRMPGTAGYLSHFRSSMTVSSLRSCRRSFCIRIWPAPESMSC